MAEAATRTGAARCQRPGGLDLTRRGLGHMPLPAGAVVADMGCGSGESVRHLRGLGYAALGLDKEQCAPAAAPAFPFILARAEAPPLAAHSLDALLCECVLCLLPEPEQVLRLFAGLLRPGGHMLLSDIYRPGLGPEAEARTEARTGAGPDFLTRKSLEAALYGAGLDLLHFEDHSRALKDYAAQMLWHGKQSAADCRLLRAAQGCGYGLWIAHKPKEA